MKEVAKYGLVVLWNEVVELLSQGKSMTSAAQSVAIKTGVRKTAIKKAIHCLGQVLSLRLGPDFMRHEPIRQTWASCVSLAKPLKWS